jgi:hypothetical protein
VGIFIDLEGKCFGRLEVFRFVGIDGRGEARWRCRCSCGKTVTITGYSIRSGHTRSCGCLRIQHGHTRGRKCSPTFHTWHSMAQRCTNKKATQFVNYGGAGVRVHRRWRTFENFLADMGERPAGTTLGRKGDVGNYEPGNCRWESHSESERQRRAKRARKAAAAA